MKRLPVQISVMGGLLAWLVGSALAGPVQRAQVAADAKWLLHLDLDAARQTQLGQFLQTKVAPDKIAKAKTDLKAALDFDFDLERIHSLTAYGTDYQVKPDARGVLIIQTDLDVQRGLQTAMRKQTAEWNAADLVKQLESDDLPFYSIKNELYVAVQPGKFVMLGKARDQVEKAVSVFTGKGASLTSLDTFAEFPPAPNAFFFLGVAEGFSENAPLPPNAKVLQLTDKGRLILGENDGQVFLSLALKAKTAEVSQQIRQVVQGMVALVALGQVKNPDLQQLAQSAKVNLTGEMVTLDVALPVDAVISKIAHKARAEQRAKGEAH